jgi:hypothetical protein
MPKGFSQQVREIVQQRATDIVGLTYCERCSTAASDLQYHHRRPRGMGGSKAADTNLASNCLLLCGMCHLYVESYRDVAFAKGWLVHAHHDPLATPVLYQNAWMLLDNDGHTYRIPNPATGGVA